MVIKRTPLYRSAWVQRSERALQELLAGPVPLTPFVFADDARIPLSDLSLAVTKVAKVKGWAVFGPNYPASDADLIQALQDRQVVHYTRVIYKGKIRSGKFAEGLDVRESYISQKTAIKARMYTCECGYKTVDDTAAAKHGRACKPMSATKILLGTAPSEEAFVVRVYKCENPACSAHSAGKLWVSRQAAHNHKHDQGCLMSSDRQRLYVTG